MPRSNIKVTRRDALQSVGSGAAAFGLAGGAASSTAASAQSTATDPLGAEHGWTAHQSRGSGDDGYHSGHVLTYLDVSWERFGRLRNYQNEPPGCWRHTFALTGVGVNADNEGQVGWDDRQWKGAIHGQVLPGLPYSTVSVNVPRLSEWDDDTSHPSADVWSGRTRPLEDGVAVSARRHPSLLTFFERYEFGDAIAREGVSPEAIREDPRGGDLHDALFESRREVEESRTVGDAVPSDSEVLSTLLTAHTAEMAGEAYEIPSAAVSAAVGYGTSIPMYLEALLLERLPRFDHGFAVTFPEEIYEEGDAYPFEEYTIGDVNATDPKTIVNVDTHNDIWFGAGGHAIVFDVFEYPWDPLAGVVDVVSAFDRGGPRGRGPSAGWSLVLDTPAPENGAPESVPVADRFSAEVVASDDVTRREEGGD